ncbi:DMT family transporter [Magnetovibrio sp.]|uniref:DMT family transporter n=1 Tax=Magnetovibrio sp. TaxID=2024836 RepID=UPI002F948100
MVRAVMPSLMRDLGLLIVLATIWSSSFTVIKVGVEVIPPVTLTMIRIVVAAGVLYAWLKAKGQSLPSEPRVWWSFFLIGCFGNAFPFTMINWGEQVIPSGLAAIMIASMPLAALLLGRIFSDEELNVRRLTGVLVGFGGVVYLIGPQELMALGEQALRQLAVALAAVLYAVSGILVRKLPKASPLEHGTGVLIASSVILIPASLFGDQPWTIDFTADALAAGVYLGVLPTALATIILMTVIASRGVTFLALNNYLIPILGVMWGALFLDEAVSSDAIVALTLIFVGIAIAGIGPATRVEATRAV